MKKAVLYMLIIYVLMISLFSCEETDFNTGDTSGISNSSETIPNAVTTINTTNNSPNPKYYFYYFYSYDEFLSQFSSDTNVSDSEFLLEKSIAGELNERFIDYMSSLETIELPRRNGELMDLDRITYFTYEKRFDYLPSIWYHVLYNNQEICIKVTYPSVKVNTAEFSKLHASEILRILSPDDLCYGKIEDFDYKNGIYKNVYRTDVELIDQKVTAVVYEYKENNKIDIYFYYRNAMVWITAKSDVLNEEFFKSFSLG